MDHVLIKISLLLLFGYVGILQATSLGDNSYWLCYAFDQDNKQWSAKSSSEKSSLNQAFSLCKKESITPKSCQVAKEFCEIIINDEALKPMWQCRAFDQMAKSFVSSTYRNRDAAALGAKAICEQLSGMPESCYVHLITCNDLNEKA